MGKIIDYGRFAERLRRPAGRWDLLRGFQEEWGYEVPQDARSWERDAPNEHKEYVRGLSGEDGDDSDPSLPIPEALGEWWDLPFNSFVHSARLYETNPEWPPTLRPDPTGYGVSDALPPGSPFMPANGDPRLCVFMAENQYCNEWGYLAADSAEPDPRVLVSTGDDWVLQAASVSQFFLHLAVDRLPRHFGWTVEVSELPGEVLERLRAAYPPLGLEPWCELGRHVTAYGAPDAILFHDTGIGDFELVATGRTEEALREVARVLEVDWDEWICEPESTPPRLNVPGGDGYTIVSVSEEPLARPDPGLEFADGLRLPDGVTATAGMPGPIVAMGDADGLVSLWAPGIEPEPFGVARRGGPVTAVALARLETGRALAAAWADGTVRLWDLDSGEAADLELGPAIEVITLDAGATLRAGGPAGTATLALDPDGLWPARSVMVRLHRIDWSGLHGVSGPATAFPDLLAAARGPSAPKAVAALGELLHRDGEVAQAAAASLPYLLVIASLRATPARVELLELAGRIIHAVRTAPPPADPTWHDMARQVVEDITPAIHAIVEMDDDPAVRAAASRILESA
ncbi:WD40 repeat domain-containing protein [Actinomadura macrotermitis]|uniref:Uncharacterized protein n=1 Tax=Actinomadura macrotermitis TaxID=2585200 RepID=A0A7K0BY83_9ACTN|nr:hypothetical protein [Actinomadura macrotermitis]MQY05584.1 hypothetical protein [Actinomadura macrotermitis]